MASKKMKYLWTTLAVLGIVGGAVHILQPLGTNLLTLFNSFGGYANWVQALAGVGAVVYIVKKQFL